MHRMNIQINVRNLLARSQKTSIKFGQHRNKDLISPFPKVPTNFVAVIVALTVTVPAVLILCAVMEITVMWYYAVGAVVLGLFVGYAAMFGFDKFKAAWDKLKTLKK